MATIDVTPATATTPSTYKVRGYNKKELYQRVQQDSKGIRDVSRQSVSRWLNYLNYGGTPLDGYSEDHVKILVTYGKHLLVHSAGKAKEATLKELSTDGQESTRTDEPA